MNVSENDELIEEFELPRDLSRGLKDPASIPGFNPDIFRG